MADRLARTFVKLADTLVDEFDVVKFLHMLVDRCIELRDVSTTGLMLTDSLDRLPVMASPPRTIRPLKPFQLQNYGGPCWSATAPARRTAP